MLDNLESVLDQDNRIKDEHAGLRLFVEELLLHEHCALLIATSRCELAMSTDELEARVFARKRLLPLDKGLPLPDAVALLKESDPDGSLGVRGTKEDALKQLAERCGCIPRTLLSVIGRTRIRNGVPGTRSSRTSMFYRASSRNRNENSMPACRRARRSMSSRPLQCVNSSRNPVPAVAVGHMLPALRVGDVLHQLVLNHVISFSPASRRYSLNPAFLQYAYDQIRRGAGDSHLLRMHGQAAGFYEKLCKEKSEWKCIEDLEPQLRQIRHLIAAQSCDRACEVLNTIDREYLGLWRYSNLVIELRGQMLDRITNPYLAALNLGNMGAAYFERGEPGDWAIAIKLYTDVISRFRELGKRADEGRFIGNKGLLLERQGSARAGEQLLVEAFSNV